MSNIPLEERRKWIGGSDIAALFGKSSYRTAFELWHEKAGNIHYVEEGADDRRLAGQYMEPAIAAWAQEKWGLRLRKVRRYIPHKAIRQFGASLDYETVEGRIPYEIKNVDSLIFRDYWDHQGDTITKTPIDYLLQCQAQLACTGKPYHGLVACVGGNTLFRMELPRHEPTIKAIEAKIPSFWESVHESAEPKPNFAEDAQTIARLYVNSGGGCKDMNDSDRLREVLEEYQRAKAVAKAADESAAAAKAECLTLIGDADIVKCGPFTLSTKTVSPTKVSYTRRAYRGFHLTEYTQEEAEVA